MSADDETSEEKVVIKISGAQGLVLFEFLRRFSDERKLEIRDQAEERVLWNLCCDLESMLVGPLLPEYGALLQKARDSVRDSKD